MTNCKNCGAPFRKVITQCEYCGTMYAAGVTVYNPFTTPPPRIEHPAFTVEQTERLNKWTKDNVMLVSLAAMSALIMIRK